MLEVLALAQQCAPTVHPTTMAAIVQVESGFNPFAIGVVGGRLARQARSKAEAVATAQALAAAGHNFSLGIAQVNRYNLPKYGLSYESAFDPCANLRAASLILQDCFERASMRHSKQRHPLHAALSCYYSGDFSTGFRPNDESQLSYVQKVLNGAEELDEPVGVSRRAKSNLSITNRATLSPSRAVPVLANMRRHPHALPEHHRASIMVYR